MRLFLASATLRMLALCAFVMLVPTTTWAADNGEADFAKGWDLLKHKKYKEARAALETGMKKNPRTRSPSFIWPMLAGD